MDFRYDDDELTILEEARQTLSRYLPRERFFHGSEAAGAGDWQAVAEGGWLHAGLPEDLGGADLPLHLIAGIAKEAGALLVGDAFVNNAVIIPRLLTGLDDPTAALADHATRRGFPVVDGRTRLVGMAGAAAPWCFGVEHGFSGYALTDVGLRRFDPEALSFEPLGGVGLGVGRVALKEGESIVLLGRFPPEVPLEALVAHAASLVGLGESALRDTRDYVLERNQFGGPIGRFQAIKHELADIAVELEIAWNAVLYASLRLDERSALVALYEASRAVLRAARSMIQFFGGIGVTVEHHAQLVLKMAATSARRFGSQDEHAAAIGRHLLGAAT